MSEEDDHSKQRPETALTETSDQSDETRERICESDSQSNSDRDGFEGTTPARAGEESLPMRRRSLLSSLAGAALAGAGGAAMDGPITPASAESDESGGTSSSKEIEVGFSATITEARVVQVVEKTRAIEFDSRVEFVAGVSDPDLVADKPGTVVFDLETDLDTIPPVEEFPEKIGCKIRVNAGNGEETHKFSLPGSAVRRMLANKEVDLAKAAESNGVNLPAFPVNSNLMVEIEFAPKEGYIEAEPVVIGSNGYGDFEMPEIHDTKDKLNVGFIGIRDPSGDDSNFTSTENTPNDLETLAEAAVDFLEKTYPVPEVNGVVYHEPVQCSTWEKNIPVTGDVGSMISDMETAKQKLTIDASSDEITQSNEKVTILGDENKISDIDEVVMIVGDGYSEFMIDKNKEGLKIDFGNAQPIAAAFVEDLGVDRTASTVGHEIGHYYLHKPYDGDEEPLAMQNPPGEKEGPDTNHAAPARGSNYIVKSDGYEYIPDADEFRVLTGIHSAMSYSTQKRWSDSHMYQSLIEGNFQPNPDETKTASNPVHRAVRLLFSGAAVIEGDGSARVTGTTLEEDVPSNPTDTEESADRSDADDVVQFDVIGTNDEVLETSYKPSALRGRPNEGETEEDDSEASDIESNVATFRLPFPKEAKELKITYQGTTTTVQPLAVNLRDVARRLPAEAFKDESRLAALSTEDGEAEREALIDAAQRMGDALDQNAYSAASDILDSEIAPIIQNLNADYPGAVNVPDYDELQTMVDTTSERVQALADELEDSESTAEDFDGGGGGSISTERTSLHDQNDGAC